MPFSSPRLAIGLMSGTSLDGVDAALISSDGGSFATLIAFFTMAFSPDFRSQLKSALLKSSYDASIIALEQQLTYLHAVAAQELLRVSGIPAMDIEVVGFHGQTLFHAPERGVTFQIGDGQLLADILKIPVVNDFRSADVKAGGQGAPLVPLYHLTLARGIEKPVVVLNLGGVANITWISETEANLMAFDTGPGNALLDDWISEKSEADFDRYGKISARGSVQKTFLDKLLEHPFFDLSPPKSLDRNTFTWRELRELSLEDGAATLVAFTAATVAKGLKFCPQKPKALAVSGGGRKNRTLMKAIADLTGCTTKPIEFYGCNGDALEAEAFAYLALRSLCGDPISLPGTTGIKEPLTGGRSYYPRP